MPFLHGQTFQVRTIESEYGYVEVQIRETSGINMPTTSTDITDLQFEIRWPQSYGSDVDVDIICADFNLIEGLGGKQVQDANYWRVFAAVEIPFSPNHNWVVNHWESIGIFKVLVTSSTGNGSFQLSPDDWVFQGLNFGIDGVDYAPLVYSNVTEYNFPTIVYDYVWLGGEPASGGYNESSWSSGSNWEDPCGLRYSIGNPPTALNNCIIPTGRDFWPTNFNNKTSGVCDILWVRPNALLEIPNGVTLTTLGELFIEGGIVEVKSGGTIITD